MLGLSLSPAAEADNSFHLLFYKEVKSLHLNYLATTKHQMEVAMKQKAILTALFVFFCLVTNALAGEAVGSDKIKEMLIRPGGWSVEWRGNTYSGVSDCIFEERGENIVVKIHSASVNMSCERNVTITEDAVKYDACYDTGITLHYDPDDKEYPFKGESQTTNYKLKAK